MRKINGTKHKEKSVLGAIQNTLGINQIEHLASDSNRLSTVHYAESTDNLQCHLCSPLSRDRRGITKLCSKHCAEVEILATALFGQLTKSRKIVRLHRCLSCNGRFAPSKFSAFWGICKVCVTTAQDKSKTAQSNFVERTANNIRKVLGRAIAL